MRHTVLAAFVAAALSAPAFAQDSNVKSRTDIKADDAKVISMVGCLRSDPATHGYSLVGHIAAAGDDVTAKSKVWTDVDMAKTTVQGKTEVKGDNDKAVATAGDIAAYALIAAPEVNLAPNVGQQVQISALQVEKGHGDADVKIKDETKVERENAPDSKSNSKTKLELPRSPNAAYTVVKVTSLGMPCAR
jgi:opacity protein-like surface antigen